MKTKIDRFVKLTMMVCLIAAAGTGWAAGINVSGQGRISGNIRGATSNSTLEYVSVALFSASDSSMVAGTISDRNGNFYFSMLGNGKYFLEIRESGFENKFISPVNILNDDLKIDLGEIVLIPSGTHKRHKK